MSVLACWNNYTSTEYSSVHVTEIASFLAMTNIAVLRYCEEQSNFNSYSDGIIYF
jgi:hypothetical protein